jgi:hypothetical protein
MRVYLFRYVNLLKFDRFIYFLIKKDTFEETLTDNKGHGQQPQEV